MPYGRRRRRRWTPDPTPTPYTPTPQPNWNPATAPATPSVTATSNTVSHRFESFDSMIAFAESTPEGACPMGQRSSRDANHAPAPDWDANAGWQGALTMAREGWPEGAAAAQKYTDALFAKLVSRVPKPTMQWGQVGLDWDIGRVMNGDPDHWWHHAPSKRATDKKGKKFARVVVNVSAVWFITAETLIARGAVVAALVELLEYAGHRVEVVIASCTESGKRYTCEAVVKPFDHPLDMRRVAYTVAHPSVLRRLVFALKENCPEYSDLGVPYGYGRPTDMPDDRRGDIYCPAMRGDGGVPWEDPKAAERWIIHELGKQGVNLTLEV